jgi:hypothetical protein
VAESKLTPEERQAFDEALAEELGEARKAIDADEAMRISVKNPYIMEQIAARARTKDFPPEKQAHLLSALHKLVPGIVKH